MIYPNCSSKHWELPFLAFSPENRASYKVWRQDTRLKAIYSQDHWSPPFHKSRKWTKTLEKTPDWNLIKELQKWLSPANMLIHIGSARNWCGKDSRGFTCYWLWLCLLPRISFWFTWHTNSTDQRSIKRAMWGIRTWLNHFLQAYSSCHCVKQMHEWSNMPMVFFKEPMPESLILISHTTHKWPGKAAHSTVV